MRLYYNAASSNSAVVFYIGLEIRIRVRVRNMVRVRNRIFFVFGIRICFRFCFKRLFDGWKLVSTESKVLHGLTFSVYPQI